jgi:hypothetical protein
MMEQRSAWSQCCLNLDSVTMRTFASFSLALLVFSVSSANAQERIDAKVNAAIREEGFKHSRVLETAQMISDGYGPRLAGSPGYKSAAAWARDRLAEFHAANAKLDPWGKRGLGWEATSYSVEMTSPAYLRLNVVPLAWSRGTDGVAQGVPLIAEIRSDKDFGKWRGKLRGRIVMLQRVPPIANEKQRFTAGARRFTDAELDSMSRLSNPGDPKDYWEDADGFLEGLKAGEKVKEFLRTEGVLVTLRPSNNELALSASSYNSYDSPTTNNLAGFVVDRAQYRRLQTLLDRGAEPQLAISLGARYPQDDSVGFNIVGEIPGTDPTLKDELVMVGGHFDSWHAGTGATDNAAGCAVAIEVLRILNAIGVKPRRTIRVALWDGEEQEDYFGSLGYVKNHFGDPVTMQLKPEHSKLSAYFNVDNGTGKVRGIYMQGNTAVKPIFAAMLEPFRDLGATTLTIANHGSTDHMAFMSVGLPGFEVIQDPIDYDPRTHHTSLDGAGFFMEDDLMQASVVVASLVYHTAMRDEKLPRMPLPRPKGMR